MGAPESKQDNPKRENPMAQIARYSEIGFILPAAVLIGLIFGLLLDKWLHTKWLYLAGLIFGAVVGFIQLIRSVTSTDTKQ
ncbi:MAG TPA: AtpZ/AtpI family protein [Terriglobales bacterium]|nr:AtpZ/AtpI family protein [Terriglobales bacterium]